LVDPWQQPKVAEVKIDLLNLVDKLDSYRNDLRDRIGFIQPQSGEWL
jgi:hypothetical protein